MARLYANENFPLPVVERLRHLGHDVLTTTETGRHDQALADEAVNDLIQPTDGAALAQIGGRRNPHRRWDKTVEAR